MTDEQKTRRVQLKASGATSVLVLPIEADGEPRPSLKPFERLEDICTRWDEVSAQLGAGEPIDQVDADFLEVLMYLLIDHRDSAQFQKVLSAHRRREVKSVSRVLKANKVLEDLASANPADISPSLERKARRAKKVLAR